MRECTSQLWAIKAAEETLRNSALCLAESEAVVTVYGVLKKCSVLRHSLCGRIKLYLYLLKLFGF